MDDHDIDQGDVWGDLPPDPSPQPVANLDAYDQAERTEAGLINKLQSPGVSCGHGQDASTDKDPPNQGLSGG